MNRMPGWYKLGSGGPTAVGGGSPVLGWTYSFEVNDPLFKINSLTDFCIRINHIISNIFSIELTTTRQSSKIILSMPYVILFNILI
jgi:hypothetical protein